MQDLKSDTVLFLTNEKGEPRDRAAAKLLAPCEVEVRHVDTAAGDAPIDVLIHATSGVAREAHDTDAANRVENAMRRASAHPIRLLQWVEEGVSSGPRPGTGAGDANSGRSAVSRSGSGMPPRHHRDSQGYGSSQSPAQPGDRQINPPPNPRR